MKKLYYLIFLIVFNYSLCAQSDTKTTGKFMFDAGVGLSKIRTGYGLYTDFTGMTYANLDKKYDYTPLYSLRTKFLDGNFKYRLFLNYANTKQHIIHDTTYTHTTDYHFRGFYPRLGFERMLWSKWVEFKIGFDLLYFYELYDVSNFATGVKPFPNAPLTQITGTSKHKTNAWGFSPLLVLGVPIKDVIFISVEAGKSYAYGTTNAVHTCTYLNLNTNHANEMNDTGAPTPFYRLTEFNNYVQISVDYRFK